MARRGAIADVVSEGGVEERRRLAYRRNVMVEAPQVELAKVEPIEDLILQETRAHNLLFSKKVYEERRE